jgi:Fanconi anemia group D2 protein
MSEIDSALDILVGLVEESASAIVPFTTFIKGMLDYLDGLQDLQVRKAYQVFAALAFFNQEVSFFR